MGGNRREEFGPGDRGHDGWVIGDEPVVYLDSTGQWDMGQAELTGRSLAD